MKNHYKITLKFWPKFWPKKYKILTEFVHFDRIRSVEKTCVEISFWRDGQKNFTEIPTVWQSVKILLWPKILTESRSKFQFDRIFDRHFRSKFRLWPNFDRHCGQNYANRTHVLGKILTEIGQNFGQNFKFDRKFDRPFRSKLNFLTEFWPTARSKNCIADPWVACRGKILTEIGQNFGHNWLSHQVEISIKIFIFTTL